MTVRRALAKRGVAVPRAMSVTGFDDDPIAEWGSPALTTVRQDFAEMGRRALALLAERLVAGSSCKSIGGGCSTTRAVPRASGMSYGR